MKKLFVFWVVFLIISTLAVTAQGQKERPVMQVKMEEIQEVPVLSIDANGTITNTAKPIYGTGKLGEINLNGFKNWKKELVFSETFVSQPEDNKTIIFIIAINKSKEVSYIKDVDIKREIRNTSMYITLLKVPLEIVSIRVIILEKTIYKVTNAQLVYKNREPVKVQKAYQDSDYIPYEYIPPTFSGH